MGECFFWYRPTPVVPDKRPLKGCVYNYLESWKDSCGHLSSQLDDCDTDSECDSLNAQTEAHKMCINYLSKVDHDILRQFHVFKHSLQLACEAATTL